MEDDSLGVARQVLVMAIVISIILLFLGIGVLILIHGCIVGRTMRNGLSERNMMSMEERGSLGSTSMSQDDIEKLPCFDFAAKAKGSSPAADCAVCLENFKAGERCRLLPSCHHSFHADCVDLWLLRTPICPICRATASGHLTYSGTGEEREEGGTADQTLLMDAPVLDSDGDGQTTEASYEFSSSDRSGIQMRERC